MKLFETPNYGGTFAQCQRYLYKVEMNRSLFGSTSGNGDSVNLVIDLPVEMRTTPVITGLQNFYIRYPGGQYGPFTPTNLRVIVKIGNQISFQFDNPSQSQISGGLPLVAFSISDWFISAEL